MTDNEKRAHDFAIMVTQLKAQFDHDACSRQGKPFHMSFIDVYQATYDEAMAYFESHTNN